MMVGIVGENAIFVLQEAACSLRDGRSVEKAWVGRRRASSASRRHASCTVLALMRSRSLHLGQLMQRSPSRSRRIPALRPPFSLLVRITLLDPQAAWRSSRKPPADQIAREVAGGSRNASQL